MARKHSNVLVDIGLVKLVPARGSRVAIGTLVQVSAMPVGSHMSVGSTNGNGVAVSATCNGLFRMVWRLPVVWQRLYHCGGLTAAAVTPSE